MSRFGPAKEIVTVNRHRQLSVKHVVVLGLVLGLSLGYAVATGPGHATDWQAFRQWTLGQPHEMGVWNPFWTKLILTPIAWLPQAVGHAVINMLTFSAILLAGNQYWSLLTFALHNHAWVGNLDGFIVTGMILARRRNPYVVGTGLFLMSIKPQYLPLGLYYIWRCKDWRLFVPPLIGLSLSFFIYGNWIPAWLETLPPTPHTSVNVSFYPWLLPVWLLLPLAADKERFVLSAVIVTSPYFNQIGLFTLFAFRWPSWIALILILLGWVSPLLVGPFALIYALLVKPQAADHAQLLGNVLVNRGKVWKNLVQRQRH